MVDTAFSPDLRRQITDRLAKLDRHIVTQEDLRLAAVAIVVTEMPDRNEASVLVTLRPEKLNRHGGQYALPGGRLDPGETDEVAALRELSEELGLTADIGNILGRLDDFPTRSGFRIAPIVLWMDDVSQMTPDPGEVAQVHHLPFSELNSSDIPRLTDSTAGNHPVLSAYFPTLGHYMYAPTAAILYQFREVAIRETTTRAAHFEQPEFAWK